MKIHVQENKSGYKSDVKGIHLKNCFRLLNVGEMVIIFFILNTIHVCVDFGGIKR